MDINENLESTYAYEGEENNYIDGDDAPKSVKNKKCVVVSVVSACILVVIIAIITSVINAGLVAYPETNIPDFGKYIGVDLEHEGYTDMLGKVYRYNVAEILESDPGAKKLTEYTTLLVDQYGYSYMGQMGIEGGYCIFLKDNNCALTIIMTNMYCVVSIKDSE